MFFVLFIVCDEFFIFVLVVIMEKLDILEDVVGVIFMVVGGSMLEFCILFIGVFVDLKLNVGFGIIVGLVVFNVLFVIGMCVVFLKEILCLIWWLLFCDCIFYSMVLIMLIGFFIDEVIEWWELLILIGVYVCYVIFMKYNYSIESWVKR